VTKGFKIEDVKNDKNSHTLQTAQKIKSTLRRQKESVTAEQKQILVDWTLNYIKKQGQAHPKYFEQL